MGKEIDGISAVKALAEMTYIFFTHLLEVGATIQEASAMTSAYIQAITFGNPQKSGDPNGDS